MSTLSIDLKQLRHDLRGLVEPLETVKMLLESGKVDQATRIQNATLEILKKLVQGIDVSVKESRGGDA